MIEQIFHTQPDRVPIENATNVAPLVDVMVFNQQRQQEMCQSMEVARAVANQYRRLENGGQQEGTVLQNK